MANVRDATGRFVEQCLAAGDKADVQAGERMPSDSESGRPAVERAGNTPQNGLNPPNYSFHYDLDRLPLVGTFVLPLHFNHAQPLQSQV